MAGGFATLSGRFWRLLSLRWQREPLASGAHLTGGRWNARGTPAIYFGVDHATAIAEYHQALVQPGTLVGYDIKATAVVDLCNASMRADLDIGDDVPTCEWRLIHAVEAQEPPSWTVAQRLIEAGAHGALVPSVQREGGVNLVLWRWSADGSVGAKVTAIDPHGDLHAR